MHFLNVVGARPNFMKIAPFQWELDRHKDCAYTLVHTGQHYDESMSGSFFNDLSIREPDRNLDVGSASHAVQTGNIMIQLDEAIDEIEPDWVVVVGDVNSTLAAAVTASKKSPDVAHIEAGIRSGDRSMPEEINRMVVDRIADRLFCFDQKAVRNLKNEGIPEERIRLSGDIMIDSLLHVLDRSEELDVEEDIPEEYALLTLHRPSNVDHESALEQAFDILRRVQETYPVVFPIHPRTEERLKEYERLEQWKNTFHLLPPQPYPTFVQMMNQASVVLTDSGSMQQETTVLDIPCLTLRENTEREITINKGTNKLVGLDRKKIIDSVRQISNDNWKSSDDIDLWDGRTARRIVQDFLENT